MKVANVSHFAICSKYLRGGGTAQPESFRDFDKILAGCLPALITVSTGNYETSGLENGVTPQGDAEHPPRGLIQRTSDFDDEPKIRFADGHP